MTMHENEILREYMTGPELCQQLGVCSKTLTRWHALGTAPPKTKIGRRVYYKRRSVATWLATREQKAA